MFGILIPPSRCDDSPEAFSPYRLNVVQYDQMTDGIDQAENEWSN